MIFEIDDYFFLKGYNDVINIDDTFLKGGSDMDGSKYINRFGIVFALFFIIAMIYILCINNESVYQFYQINGYSNFE